VARKLQKSGWLKTRALAGGWDAWQAAGLPVESKPML
jgi:3-mercaptopyruvate sulfurtransferase SseA